MAAELEFVDLSVALYAFDPRSGPRHGRALTLLDGLLGDGRGAISTTVLEDFFATVTAAVPEPTSVARAKRGVGHLANLRTYAPDADDLLAAIDASRSLRIDLRRALAARAAARLGCAIAWSAELPAGKSYEGVRFVSPFDQA